MPKLWADSLDDHRALVRERLVAAYAGLAAEQPLDEITVAAVAARAEMARSAVYNHVDHLHDLALWHAEGLLADWIAEVESSGEGLDAMGRLEHLVRRSFDVFASDPTAGKDLAAHLDDERQARLVEILRPIMGHLTAVVHDGIAGGELVDEEPSALVTHVWAVVSGYRAMLGDGRVEPGPAADVVVRMLRRSLAAEGRPD